MVTEEISSEIHLEKVLLDFTLSQDKGTVLDTLHQTLASFSKFIESADHITSDKSVPELGKFLDSISEFLLESEYENESADLTAIEILTHIKQYLVLPYTKQEVIDELAFEVPKAVARFACISKMCSEMSENIIDLFVERCSPRDMLSILCDALGSPSKLLMVPGYFIPLVSGLAKVLILIERRHYAHVKVVVPGVLSVLKTICFEAEDEDVECERLFHKAIAVADSVWAVCLISEGKDNHKLRALLGLYVLQMMALVSSITKHLSVVLELSNFLRHCELSYVGMITGCEIDAFFQLIVDDGIDDDDMNCFSLVKLGAALGVIWGYKNSEVATAAKTDFSIVIMELQSNWTRRWEAIGMLKHIFLFANLSWELKKHAVEFLLYIMDGIVSSPYNDDLNYSMFTQSFFTSLQTIEMVIMYTPDVVLRKNAFSAFKKMLADIPASLKFDVLRTLITNSESSSMIGILLDIVKQEMIIGRNEKNSSVCNNEVTQHTTFWNPNVLDLVEDVLNPLKDGPTILPEYSDAVLSVLNLYRFILITEATGKSNYTGIMSKDKLQKSYKEWFLALRTLVIQNAVENQIDQDHLTSNTLVEMVLQRCIELVEEKLEHI